MRRTLLLIIFLGSIFSGCSAAILGAKDQFVLLPTAADQYHRALHWNDTPTAATFIIPEQRAKLSRLFDDRAKKEKITKFEVRSIEFDDATSQGVVETRVSFYRIPNLVVQTRDERERWEYRWMEGRWLLVSTELLPQE